MKFVCKCGRGFEKFYKYYVHCSHEHPEVQFIMERPEEE